MCDVDELNPDEDDLEAEEEDPNDVRDMIREDEDEDNDEAVALPVEKEERSAKDSDTSEDTPKVSEK